MVTCYFVSWIYLLPDNHPFMSTRQRWTWIYLFFSSKKSYFMFVTAVVSCLFMNETHAFLSDVRIAHRFSKCFPLSQVSVGCSYCPSFLQMFPLVTSFCRMFVLPIVSPNVSPCHKFVPLPFSARCSCLSFSIQCHVRNMEIVFFLWFLEDISLYLPFPELL